MDRLSRVLLLTLVLAISSASEGGESTDMVLVEAGAPLVYKVPVDSSEDDIWTSLGFNDSAWTRGNLGIGYDSTGPSGAYAPFLQTEILHEMRQITATNFIRIPFDAPETTFVSLTLRIRYDDGFVAFLNGVEVARDNAPETLNFSSRATGTHPDSQALVPIDFDLTLGLPSLNVGDQNILAIHGLNSSSGSADYMIEATLLSQIVDHVVPTSIQPIASIERTLEGIRFTMPVEFDCVSVGMQYSNTLKAGSWIDLGNFINIDGIPTFTDPDPVRAGHAAGYYRAVLRLEP